MDKADSIPVFIGSGEASRLERKVAIYSLYKNTQRNLDIYVLNGTHNAIEFNDQEPYLAPMSLRIKYKNITEFSLYRFLIPEIMNYQGKAIYLDSDIICLGDIGNLFDLPLNGKSLLARNNAYVEDLGANFWALSVMLMNCESCRFDLEMIQDELEQELYGYTDFSCMTPNFLKYHPHKIGELDSHWNVLDYADEQTQLIHYTNLRTQPWKHYNHAYGELWFTYFQEAMAAGYVTQEDINLSINRSYIRGDILQGNSPPKKPWLMPMLRKTKNALRQLIK